MILPALVGCNPLPDVAYETQRLQIAPDFDHPICAGTLVALDDHVRDVERTLGQPTRMDQYRLYWMDASVGDFCGDGRGGCFYPGTRAVFARGASVTHELVHAVLDSGGQTYFVEEGMAEVLSGVGVYFDADHDDDRPTDGFRMTRSSYREGNLDYAAAAHFVRWVRNEAGSSAMLRLADDIEADADGGRLAETIEEIFDAPVDDVEARYLLEAPRFFPGLYESHTPTLDLGELLDGMTLDLDCEAEHTRGPVWDDAPGMYRVERLTIPRSGQARLEALGDPDGPTWIVVFDPHARIHDRVVTDWSLPNPAVDPNAIALRPGETVEVGLARQTYLVVFGSDDPQVPAQVGLRLTLARPENPTQEGSPAPEP